MKAALILIFIVACGDSKPTPKVADCSARYAACVGISNDIQAYRICRANTDAVCLNDASAP